MEDIYGFHTLSLNRETIQELFEKTFKTRIITEPSMIEYIKARGYKYLPKYYHIAWNSSSGPVLCYYRNKDNKGNYESISPLIDFGK